MPLHGAKTHRFSLTHRRGFERFLRKLAKLPQWPALLYLHVWQPDYMGPAFWHGGEMQVETVLQYYGIPSVSARNALFHLTAQNVSGFAEDDIFCGVHPNPLGHRYVYPVLDMPSSRPGLAGSDTSLIVLLLC